MVTKPEPVYFILPPLPQESLVPHHYRLELPRLDLPWLTSNHRRHYFAHAKEVKAWRQLAHKRAKAVELPMLNEVYVVAELRFARHNRRRDPANWAPTAKAAIDGLVDYEVLHPRDDGRTFDDNHQWIIGPDMRIGGISADESLVLHLWRLD